MRSKPIDQVFAALDALVNEKGVSLEKTLEHLKDVRNGCELKILQIEKLFEKHPHLGQSNNHRPRSKSKVPIRVRRRVTDQPQEGGTLAEVFKTE